MNDQNKKTLRQFQCRDYLWEIFEQMSGELECSVDYLINEAMRQYARSRNYGARTGPTPDPTGQRSIRDPQPTPAAAMPRQRVPSQPAIPSAPPPPPSRPSYPQPGQQPSYAQRSPAPQAQQPPAYPAPPGRSSGGYPAPQQYGGAGYAPPPQQGGGYPAPPPQQGYGAPQQGGYPAPPSYPQQGAPGGYPQQQGGYGAPPPRAPSGPSSYPPPPQTTRPPSLHGHGGGPPPLQPPQQPQGYAPSAPPPLPTGGAMHPPGMATLFVIFNGQKFPVNKEEFIIGRGTKTADLAIKDGNISRRHAAIIYQNGGFYMKDLGSTNGVEYQGRRVDGKRIEEGDVYQLCDYELRFTYR